MSCRSPSWNDAQRAWAETYFESRDRAAADPDRRSTRRIRSRAILNKSLNFVDRARGRGRLRPQGRRRDRAGAARAAAGDAAAAARSPARRTRFVLLTSVSAGVRRARCSRAWTCARLLPVPRDPQQRPVRRRGGDQRPARRRCRASCRSATSATRCGWRCRPRLPAPDARVPAAAVRPRPAGPLPRRRAGEPGAAAAGDRPGRPARPEVPAVRAGRARGARPARDLFAAIRQQRHAAAPPVRVVRAGDGLPAQRRRRPAGGRDQADALPHRHRLAADGVAGRRGRAPARK